jgi:hypothetical protein
MAGAKLKTGQSNGIIKTEKVKIPDALYRRIIAERTEAEKVVKDANEKLRIRVGLLIDGYKFSIDPKGHQDFVLSDDLQHLILKK